MSVQLGEWKDGELYIEGLRYSMPPKPPKKKMLNYGLHKKKQKWTRIEEYEDYDWSEGWEDRLEENPKQLNYLVEEIERLTKGVWILINGEEVYLNRFMYFFVQWYVLPDSGDYPQFRDTSLYYYRFTEISDTTRLCTGHTLIKGRRLGATSMIIARMLLKMITSKRKNFGITSKSGEDAGEEGAFGFLKSGFESLPVFLKPDIEGGEVKNKVLSLRNKPKGRKVKEGDGLLVKAFWRAPGMNTFDSGAYEEILIDETGKFDDQKTKVDIRDYLPVVTKCVKKGARVTGKLSLPTTVNPPDKGGANYRVIWNDSDQGKADYLGQTITGLYRIIIPAYNGFAGYIGEFGESIWDTPTPEQTAYLKTLDDCPDPHIGSKEYLENERKKLENRPEDLQKEIQMNPFDAEEVFESSNDRCLFNLQNLTNREKELLDKLEDLGRDIIKDELGRRGKFEMTPSGKVQFVDDKDGLWYIHYLLPEHESNKYRFDGMGRKVPLNESFGAAGLDPVHTGEATVDKGSDASCIIRRRYNSQDEENSDIPVAMFLGRLEDVDEMYKQIYNGLIYYGVKMLAERSPTYFSTYAERFGLQNYLYKTTRSDGTVVYGIPNQQSEATKEEHARVQVMKSLDDHHKIPFIRLVRDRKFFDVKKRGLYDACMADGYSLMALEYGVKQEKRKPKGIKFLRRGRVL